MNVKVFRSITEIDGSRWDAAAGKGRTLCSYKYAELLEKSGVNKDRCYYIVVYEGDDIVAHTCAYFIREELDIFARGVLKKMIRQARLRWKDFFILKSIECGPPIAPGNILSFREGVDRAQAIRLMCRGMEGLAKELGVKFILFRDFYKG
jgi:hypothetical protein